MYLAQLAAGTCPGSAESSPTSLQARQRAEHPSLLDREFKAFLTSRTLTRPDLTSPNSFLFTSLFPRLFETSLPSIPADGQLPHGMGHSTKMLLVAGLGQRAARPLCAIPAAGPRMQSPYQAPQALGLSGSRGGRGTEEPAAAVGNHTPQPAGAGGLGEGAMDH